MDAMLMVGKEPEPFSYHAFFLLGKASVSGSSPLLLLLHARYCDSSLHNLFSAASFRIDFFYTRDSRYYQEIGNG